MIIGCYAPLTIGSVLTGLTDANATYHPAQRFVVLRKATFNEWVASNTALGRVPSDEEKAQAQLGGHFYFVSTD